MFFLITRRSHEEVVAAKEQVILMLQAQLAVANDLATHIPQQLADAMRDVANAVRPRELPAAPEPPVVEKKPRGPEPKNVDYLTVDAFNEEALTRMAVAELGHAARNPNLLLRKRLQIRDNILRAQAAAANEIPAVKSDAQQTAEDLIARAEKGQ